MNAAHTTPSCIWILFVVAPPGAHEALLVMEPDLVIPDPEQLPLQVVLKAEALP